MSNRNTLYKKESHFTIVLNEAARDPSLSLKAKGLLLQMLSMNDDWKFYLTQLTSINTDGVDSIRSGIEELVQAGYILRGERERLPNGGLGGYQMAITDIPHDFSDEQKRKVGSSESYIGKSHIGKPNAKNNNSKGENGFDVDSLLITWNENKGKLPGVYSKGRSRVRGLQLLANEANNLGVEPEELLRVATLVVARNDFWVKRKYSLDNLLAGQKYLKYYEEGLSTTTKDAFIEFTFEPFYCQTGTKPNRPYQVGDRIVNLDTSRFEFIKEFKSQHVVITRSGKELDLHNCYLEPVK